jgi:beta-lactamase regulating signal transducer with metallopeptidase domain
MTTLTTLAGQPYAQALAWALLHFLWQGAILALAAMALFRVFRDSASARYGVGIVTLAAMLAAPIATTMWIAAHRDVAIAPTSSPAESAVVPAPSDALVTKAVPVATSLAPSAPAGSLTTLVLLLWTIGVAALSVRLLGGWITARRVAGRVMQPASPEVQAMVSRLASRLNLRRIVRVVESASVRVPIMIGWLKPVVILPTAVASGFTPDQVEALIVHELAHVRRHDYLVNLLQTMVETALFYHPAVWWVSKRVRTERELCCDDVAVTICDRLVYARALSDLAEMAAPHLAMAASNGSLVERVRRILGRPTPESTSGAGWVPVFVILTLVAPVLSAPMTPKPQNAATTATTTSQAPTASAAVATTTASSATPATATTEHLPAASAPAAASTAQAWTAQTQTTTSTAITTTSPQQRDNEIAELKARLQQLENIQRELDEKRSALEVQKNEAQAKAQIDELRAQLDRTAEQLQRARKQEEAGLAADPSARDLEVMIQRLQREIQAVQQAREFDIASAQLETQAANQKREYDRVLQEYALVAQARENLVLSNDAEAITDPAAQIRENDVLMIAISGEPDLPESYRVQSDGTIRLPLMPAIKVTGMTTARAAEAIVKQLNDHHLVTKPQVQVRLRRPR